MAAGDVWPERNEPGGENNNPMEQIHFTNRDLAGKFETIADLMEIKGENLYKILAYRKAADSLNNLGRSAEDLWREGQLNTIPGVGKAIAEKIDELFTTGRLGFLERLESEVPPSLAEMLRVPDLGPKKAALFWRQLGITNLEELDAAARAGKLRELPGMGEKSEAKIISGLEAYARRTDRIPLGRAWPAAQEIAARLRNLPGVERAEAAGSLRRFRSTIGDVDLLVSTRDPGPIMDAFIHDPQVEEIVAQGVVKSSVVYRGRLRAQLWAYPPERFGTALLYATGSKDHNVRLRELALDKDLSLSDRSFLKPDETEILCATEQEVYEMLGMEWVPPELREDRGEIQAALKKQLPHLIELKDIRAELHAHTTWSDGALSIRALAEAAIERGLKVLAVTDHSFGLGIVGGMTPEKVKEQRAAIDQVQKELGDAILLLQGAEVEIKADGTLDYSDEVLSNLDIVVASLHVSLRQPREQVTARLINAIRNPHVDIIGHPTGRMIPDREGADLDMDAVLAAAAESGVALELNAHPARLDLDDIYSRRAIGMGIPLAINTDAHSAGDFDMLFYGIATARRGWVEPQNVINTWTNKKLVDWLRGRK